MARITFNYNSKRKSPSSLVITVYYKMFYLEFFMKISFSTGTKIILYSYIRYERLQFMFAAPYLTLYYSTTYAFLLNLIFLIIY